MIIHIGVIVWMIISWKMILLEGKFNNSKLKLVVQRKEKDEQYLLV